MNNKLEGILSTYQLSFLSMIVQVGDAAYRELLESQNPLLGHKYFNGDRGRIRTKLVQMQCEMESHDSSFPFDFHELNFSYDNCIPELRTEKVILHIARSVSPDTLPYEAKYKVWLSNNNHPLYRQLVMEPKNTPPVAFEPYYGLLVFGGKRAEDLFATIQFPAPGYSDIADSIDIPRVYIGGKSETEDNFERKKASLKKEFLNRGIMGVIS